MMHSQKFFINVHTATLESRLIVLALSPYTSNRNRLGLGLRFGLFTALFYISFAHISRKRQSQSSPMPDDLTDITQLLVNTLIGSAFHVLHM